MPRKRLTWWSFCRGRLAAGRAAAPGKSVRFGADFLLRWTAASLNRASLAARSPSRKPPTDRARLDEGSRRTRADRQHARPTSSRVAGSVGPPPQGYDAVAKVALPR